ncbi:MAG: hypothetical protein M0D55_16120 [Elusimicrobiota bacterium]|nr:MAG: hypothetical protein M0D55_16120 [Elusimicrobiota bacterium]
MKAVLLLPFLAFSSRAAVIVAGSESSAFNRFSVLTAPGPEEPIPAVLAKSRRLLYGEHKIQRGRAGSATSPRATAPP